MDGGAWWAVVHGVTKSQKRLSDFTFFLSIVPFGEGNGTPVFLPGESHGWRGLVGCSLWGCKELDTTKQLTHTHMLNLLQYCFCFMFWFFAHEVCGILDP